MSATGQPRAPVLACPGTLPLSRKAPQPWRRDAGSSRKRGETPPRASLPSHDVPGSALTEAGKPRPVLCLLLRSLLQKGIWQVFPFPRSKRPLSRSLPQIHTFLPKICHRLGGRQSREEPKSHAEAGPVPCGGWSRAVRPG